MQTSKVIGRKYAAGASNTVNRTACKATTKPPFLFKANLEIASFKAGKETLLFLPDKLFIMQKSKIGALNYSDIISSSHTTQFIESEGVPKDTQVVGQTWKYVNKSGGPDRRFKDNRQLLLHLAVQFSPTWFTVPFQNGVSQLHSTRVLQTMSLHILIQFAQLIVPYHSESIAPEIRKREKRVCFRGFFTVDCGSKLYYCASKSIKDGQKFYRCSQYKENRGSCTIHFIRDSVLRELVFDTIWKVAKYVRNLSRCSFISLQSKIRSAEKQVSAI